MAVSSKKHVGFAFGAVTLLALLGLPASTAAFCGFYVAGADTSLYANATMVVLMRDGTRTVLSMQNNYQGPPEAFALVIPVPAVLQKEQVKVLPRDVFAKVDMLGAPRLVEYWEMDPCRPAYERDGAFLTPATASAGSAASTGTVRVEAQFAVGEYDVVVLSADDSSALDTWLRDNKYNIPQGAAPILAPYVAAGMKFFVAKVDPARVTFEGQQAVLSPLRFHYDTPEFSLPVRLGLLNSQGSQDLIVNILATQRYELANYKNATIPTNIRVQNDVRNDFASFYEALFSKTLQSNPGAVVTEYSWAANTCDPCPTQPLDPTALATLGADVLQSANTAAAGSGGTGVANPAPINPQVYGMTLTRLHARYTKDNLGEDLVFQQAPAILGGRGVPNAKGELDQAVEMQTGGFNNFQGRYVILHPWETAIACQSPQRGQWGGPNGSRTPMSQGQANTALKGAAPVAGDLPALVAESIPALGVVATRPTSALASSAGSTGSLPAAGTGQSTGAGGRAASAGAPAKPPTGGKAPASGGSQASTTPAGQITPPTESRGCGSCSPGAGPSEPEGLLATALAALAIFASRRRRAKSAQGGRA